MGTGGVETHVRQQGGSPPAATHVAQIGLGHTAVFPDVHLITPPFFPGNLNET